MDGNQGRGSGGASSSCLAVSHDQAQALGDHLGSFEVIGPRVGIDFLEQAAFDADGYDCRALADPRPAQTTADAIPRFSFRRCERTRPRKWHLTAVELRHFRILLRVA